MELVHESVSSPTPRYVAVCDVLGFSRLVQTTALEKVRDGYAELINDAIESSRLRSETLFPDGRGKTRVTPLVGTAVFSDSIIVWSLPPVNAATELVTGSRAVDFFTFIGQLILRGLRRTRCGLLFPIRAGIAYGEVVIMPREQIYVGRPIVDAYRMEQAQDWIGAACHPSCTRAHDFGIVSTDDRDGCRCVCEYPVPLHEERKARVVDSARPQLLPTAVSWPGMVWSLPNSPEDYYRNTIEDALNAEQARSGPASSASKKWENALAFGMGFRAFRDPEDKEPL